MTITAIEDIVSGFKIHGKIVSAKPFGSGHINDTYRVYTDTGNEYLLQKINHFVFKDVAGLMDNLVNVTRHLKEKLKEIPESDPEKEVLTLVESNADGFYIKDADGNYWRIFYFLKDTKSYDQVLTKKQAFEGGKAFGRFQSLLSDLDTDLIVDTIPNFHNIEHRLSNLDKVITANAVNRVNKVLSEIDFIDRRREQMNRVLQLGRELQKDHP